MCGRGVAFVSMMNDNWNLNLGTNLGALIRASSFSPFSETGAQIAAYSSTSLAQKLMELENTPVVSAIQSSLGRYDDILKPVHMGNVSAIESMMSAVDPLAGYEDGILQRTKDAMQPYSSMISEVLQDSGISSFSAAYERYSRMMEPIQESMRGIDMEMLGRAADRVLKMSKDMDIDAVSESIALEYEREQISEENSAKINVQLPFKRSETSVTKRRTIDVKEIREWLNIIIGFLSLIITITSTQPSTTNIYNNYTQQVNNYYVNVWGADAFELNMENYRIVNRNVVVRMKHDCHSVIVDYLEEGQVIRITGKYRKWRQIVWKDSEDELHMGWIQNYKLAKFKKTFPRGKRV